MEITIEDLKKLDSPNIIDIRSSDSYNKGHIQGSKNIIYNNLVLKSQLFLNKTETYYIYCDYGNTSLGLCKILRGQGYNVYSIKGGYSKLTNR